MTAELGEGGEGNGSTWNEGQPPYAITTLEVEGEGRSGMTQPGAALDCGNSGTTMRLLSGVLAASPIEVVLLGDESLSRRPMERVAEPLREMGAHVRTTDGHAPLTIEGGRLRGIDYRLPVPSAQVKGAVLLAGCAASGRTTLTEPAPVRDHTERALRALGATIHVQGNRTELEGPFAHPPFEATVPGDPSSAAFLMAAAAITSSEVRVENVGLNPTRLGFVEVLRRMGVRIDTEQTDEQMGEPSGSITAGIDGPLSGTRVEPDELPLVIDEIPALSVAAAFARGESWFLSAGELRLKESDRLGAISSAIRGLGGVAAEEGDDLVIGGGGLRGGSAGSGGDHRMAMALAICGLASERPVRIDGVGSAEVSFPGFVEALRQLGGEVEAIEP